MTKFSALTEGTLFGISGQITYLCTGPSTHIFHTLCEASTQMVWQMSLTDEQLDTRAWARDNARDT